MVIIARLVANRTFGGRYAESPVNCVEAGTQADLLACDEHLDVELVHDLNSRLLQPELVALAGLFERSLGIWTRKTVVAKKVTQRQGWRRNVSCGIPGTAQITTTKSDETRRRVELVAVWQGVAYG